MLASHFISNFKGSELDKVGLYILSSVNLEQSYQRQNFFRAGVAGSRVVLGQDRTVGPSGIVSKASIFLLFYKWKV